MRIAKLAGAPVPMLLRAQGYSGSEACGVCHESEHETWTFTRHATAFDTLVTHGANTDPECIGCHVVGFGQPGGFVSERETRRARKRGLRSLPRPRRAASLAGLHQRRELRAGLRPCHDAKHSLGFEYATFLPRVSHAANAAIAKLPLAEKQKLLAAARRAAQGPAADESRVRRLGRLSQLPRREYETWSRSAHAGAVERLSAVHKERNPDCLRCHTTGFGRPGGFPEKGRPRSTRTAPRSAASPATGRAAITSRRTRPRSARSCRSATSATPA